jgi:hypothetical protein
MSTKPPSLAQLRQLQRSRTLVRLERAGLEEGWVDGQIVGSSAKLVAIAVVATGIHPNGFNVFRRADISKLTVPAPYADFIRTIRPALECRAITSCESSRAPCDTRGAQGSTVRRDAMRAGGFRACTPGRAWPSPTMVWSERGPLGRHELR